MVVQRRRSSQRPRPNDNLHRPSPSSSHPAKKVIWAPVNAQVSAQPAGSRGPLDGHRGLKAAASAQVARARPLTAVPKQSSGPPATAQADSPPLQATLSPSPPSLLPPLKEGDGLPILDAGNVVTGRDAPALLVSSSGRPGDHSMLSLHVQDHASLQTQQDNGEPLVFGGFKAMPVANAGLNDSQIGDVQMPSMLDSNALEMVQSVTSGEQLVFGGFKAMPVCSEGQLVNPGAAKPGARQHRGARLRGKAIAAPLALPSSCAIAVPSHCQDAAFTSDQGSNVASASEGAIVPYNNEDAIARMAVDGGKRKGVLSLKLDKMLNELGPVSLSPRKRRMIILPFDGGDASPSSHA